MLYWPRRHFAGPKGPVLLDTLIRYEIAFKLLVVHLAHSSSGLQYIMLSDMDINPSPAFGLTVTTLSSMNVQPKRKTSIDTLWDDSAKDVLRFVVKASVLFDRVGEKLIIKHA